MNSLRIEQHQQPQESSRAPLGKVLGILATLLGILWYLVANVWIGAGAVWNRALGFWFPERQWWTVSGCIACLFGFYALAVNLKAKRAAGKERTAGIFSDRDSGNGVSDAHLGLLRERDRTIGIVFSCIGVAVPVGGFILQQSFIENLMRPVIR